jgi:heterodisulfide reductase subunit B
MDYSYYPGCSLHSTGVAYDDSMRATFAALDANLVDLPDWNCCGATAYMSVKETVACSVSARNLALAEQAGLDLVAPCSACWCVLTKTRKFMHELPELRENVEAALQEAGLTCKFETPVRHPLEVLLTDFGVEELAARQKHSLNGLRVACYYGCQIVRPELALEDDPEIPMALDELLAGLGATPVPYPPKARCCGGMLVATFEDVAVKLCDELVNWARVEQADCIVTTCPLCHANLELLQEKSTEGNGVDRAPLPIAYFTQLIGLALGCTPEQVGLDHNFVPLTHDFPAMMEAPSHAG